MPSTPVTGPLLKVPVLISLLNASLWIRTKYFDGLKTAQAACIRDALGAFLRSASC